MVIAGDTLSTPKDGLFRIPIISETTRQGKCKTGIHAGFNTECDAVKASQIKYSLERKFRMKDSFEKIIKSTGEDITRPGLLDTPKRAAKAFEYLTSGYDVDLNELINNALFPSDSDEMVMVKDIELYSLCEHHLLPFIGKCHVAYIPSGKVLGLSKIARVVDMFSRRLQIQETLAQQIAATIQKVTDAQGVAVIIEAKHMCMMMRGVEKQNSSMKTSATLGLFRDNQATRTEFLALLGNH